VVLWLLVLVLCVVVVALARQIGALHLRLGPRGALELDDEGPPLGRPPPTGYAERSDGRRTAIGGSGSGRLLLFVSPGCNLCEQVLPGLEAVARAADVTAQVISDSDRFETQRAFGSSALSGPELMRAWDVPGTPYAVVLDRAGIIRAKGTPNNLEQLEGLVDSARRRAREAI
jgi:methylamine dehydrogenase accessory protein MauD